MAECHQCAKYEKQIAALQKLITNAITDLAHIQNVMGTGQCSCNMCDGCRHCTNETVATAAQLLGPYDTFEAHCKAVDELLRFEV